MGPADDMAPPKDSFQTHFIWKAIHMTPSTLSFTEQLQAISASFASQMPDEAKKLFQEKAEELAQSGLAERGLRVGDMAPDFLLPDAWGNPVRLGELLREGPVVLSFYRGGWCPYCNLELRALQQNLPEFQKRGGKLVAISPETPDHSLATMEKNELQFLVLSDRGNRVARKFGLVFALPQELRPYYEKFGINIPGHNGEYSYEIPIPATYVIDQAQFIRFAFVNTDYRKRPEPTEVLAALQQF